MDSGLDSAFDEDALFSSSQLSAMVDSSPRAEPKVSPSVSSHVSSNVSSNVPSCVSAAVSSCVSPDVSSFIRPGVSSLVGPEVSSLVGPDVSSLIIPNVSSESSSNVVTHVRPKVSSRVIPNGSSHVSRDVSSQSSLIVSSKSSSNVVSHVRPNVSSHVIRNVSSQYSTNVSSPSSTNVSPQSSTNVSSHSSTNVSSQSSTNVSSQSISNVSSQSSTNVSSHSSSIVSSHSSSNVSVNTDNLSVFSDLENVDPLFPNANMDDDNESEGSNLAWSNPFGAETDGQTVPDVVVQHVDNPEGGADFAQDVTVEGQGADEDQPLPGPSGQSDANSEGNWLSYSQLMLDSYPAKSKIIYLKAYKMFERYLKSQKQFVPDVAPTEIQILNYFHYLRHEKKMAPTTLWSTYSRVNACVKRLFGFSLKNFVRVSDVLKSYESGYKVKKASIFTPQEVRYQLK